MTAGNLEKCSLSTRATCPTKIFIDVEEKLDIRGQTVVSATVDTFLILSMACYLTVPKGVTHNVLPRYCMN